MAERILVEGETCWRIAGARRASVLIDAETYFSVLRATMLKATRSIFIVGWDIDSRVRLVRPNGAGDDGAPDTLGPLLTHIAEQRPDIRIHVLLWDYSVLFALDREPLPGLNLDWRTPAPIEVYLDDVLPLGASHHQKIVVVDDAVAFCGGLDTTIRRWDTRDHSVDDKDRVDPAGEPYPPFHDVQMIVDGKAAEALAELVRTRWEVVACERALGIEPTGDPWPDSVTPDFEEVEIGVARTMPTYYDRAEVREVERLYVRAIERADRLIYIENQYLTADRVADALAARLNEKPDLRAIIIGPRAPGGWVEAKTMTAGRARFMRQLEEAGVGDRVHLHYPVVSDGNRSASVMVHAKLMIVDDAFLRVGSSNLNNRSMGFDTECDLAIEASNDVERRRITAIRNDLLAEHLGVGEEAVARVFETMDTVDTTAAIKELLASSEGGRALRPVRGDDKYEDEFTWALEGFADPQQPMEADQFIGDMFSGMPAGRRIGHAVKLGIVAAVLIGLVLVWQYSPLADFADPTQLAPWFEAITGSEWVWLLLPAVYVLGGLVMFPVTVLIALTALAFGPWTGFALAAIGSLLSAVVTYQIGAVAGRHWLRRLMGRRLNRISRAMGRKGIVSVVAMRIVPIAPFTLINLVAGASYIRFRDYLLGTVVGMTPGIVVMTALGDRVRVLWETPSAGNIALLILVIGAWLPLSLMSQAVVARLPRRRTTEPA